MAGKTGFPSQSKDMGGEKIKDGAGSTYIFPELGQAYQTIQPIGGEKVASDSLMRAMGLVASDSVEANSTKRIIKATGHSAQLYDHIRYKSTNSNQNFECVVIGVPDANTIILAAELLVDPVAGDSFEIYRSIGLSVSPTSGALQVTSAPLDVVDFIDDVDNGDAIPVPLLEASPSSPIAPRGGSFTEIVASLALRARKIEVLQDFGYRVGLYSGALGSETLVTILPVTPDVTLEVDIPAGTRLSIRSLGTTSIESGAMAINFLG